MLENQTENIITTCTYPSPVGTLILGTIHNKLCLADWQYRKQRASIDARIQGFFNAQYMSGDNLLLQHTIKQLDAYFAQQLQQFDLPLLFAGTVFQQAVWNKSLSITYGHTTTYLGLAKAMQNEKAIRAIASANGANALSIIVPCHRVIGSKGELVGYAGGLFAKQKLLQLESLIHQTALFD